LLIKYIKSVLWRVAKRLSYKQDARCLKVNQSGGGGGDDGDTGEGTARFYLMSTTGGQSLDDHPNKH